MPPPKEDALAKTDRLIDQSLKLQIEAQVAQIQGLSEPFKKIAPK